MELSPGILRFLRSEAGLPPVAIRHKTLRITGLLFNPLLENFVVKTMSKLLLWSLVAVGLIALPAKAVQAQSEMQGQPAVVISLAPISEHFDDVEHLVRKAGFAQFAPFVRMGASEYIRGVDTEKPIGVMLSFEEGKEEPNFLAFVPVTNFEDVLDTIADFADIDEGEENITISLDNGEDLIAREVDGFAFVTNTASMLSSIPSDPVAALGEMPSQYNLSAKVYGQRIPEALRQQAIEAIKQGYEQQMEMAGGGGIEEEMMKANYEMSIGQLESMIDETDHLSFGFCIDKDAGNIFMDVTMVGLPDSKYAKMCQASANAKTRFGGFVDESASATMNFATKIMEEEIPNYVNMLEGFEEKAYEQMADEMGEDELNLLKPIAQDVFGALKATLQQGELDMGAVANVGSDTFEFALGARVVDAAKVEASVKQLAAMAKDQAGDELEISLDVATEGGVRYHKFVVDIPDHETEANALIGDKATVWIGVGNDALYLAVGDSMDLLKNSIGNSDANGTKVSNLMQLDLHVAPFLEFAAQVEEDQMMAEGAKALMEEGKDRLRLSSKYVENGSTARFDVQDGLLQLIGMAAQQFGGMGGAEDF